MASGKKDPSQFVLIDQCAVGELGTNCYLVGNEDSCFLVDPGADVERIISLVSRHSSRVTLIICTHAHYDHIGAVARLKKEYTVPVLLHEADREVLEWTFTEFGVERFDVDRWLKDGDPAPFPSPNLGRGEGEGLRVLHAPGHSPGGICLVADTFVITGDTVFADGYLGRTDLPGGSERAIAASLRKIMALPDGLVIYPGHGPSSTIGREKELHGIS